MLCCSRKTFSKGIAYRKPQWPQKRIIRFEMGSFYILACLCALSVCTSQTFLAPCMSVCLSVCLSLCLSHYLLLSSLKNIVFACKLWMPSVIVHANNCLQYTGNILGIIHFAHLKWITAGIPISLLNSLFYSFLLFYYFCSFCCIDVVKLLGDISLEEQGFVPQQHTLELM